MTRTTIKISWTSNAPPAEISRPAIRRALTAFLTALGHRGATVHLQLADDVALQALNAQFRGLDKPTDILSWRYEVPAGLKGLEGAGEEAAGLPFGELAVSMDQVAEQATANGWTPQTELLRLLAHGCAHLAGYDHETAAEDREMRTVEEDLLARVGLEGLYPPAAPKKVGRKPAG